VQARVRAGFAVSITVEVLLDGGDGELDEHYQPGPMLFHQLVPDIFEEPHGTLPVEPAIRPFSQDIIFVVHASLLFVAKDTAKVAIAQVV
jgi:hypothetical protein